MSSAQYEQWLARGRAHQREQRPVDAMLCFRRAVRLDPNGAEAHLHLGQVLWQIGRLPDAVAQWREALRANANSLPARLALAEGALATTDFGLAERVADEGLALFPGNAPLLLVRGTARLAGTVGAERPDRTNAAADILQVLTLHPDLLAVPSLGGPLASALDRLGTGEAQVALLRAITQHVREHNRVLAIPAVLLTQILEQGVRDRVDADLPKLLERAVERIYGTAEHDALRRMARVAREVGDASADTLAARYAELCTQAFHSALPLVWPRRTRGDKLRVLAIAPIAGAKALLARAFATVSSATRELCDLTVAVIGAEGATAELSRLTPAGAWRTLALPLHTGLGEAKALAALDADLLLDLWGLDGPVGPLLAARPARSIITIDTVAALAPPLTDAIIAKDRLESELAARALRASAEADSLPAPQMLALFNDAVRAHQEGKLEDAARRYAQVLEHQPHHPQTLHLLGALHRESGDLEAALVHFTGALERAPNYLDARVAAAQAAMDLGRPDQAIDIARAHLADAPGYKASWRVLALAHLARGEAEIAIEVLEHVARLDWTDGETHYNHGVALQTLRRFDEAARAYQRALVFRPDLTAADYNLGVLFQEQGNTEAAIAAYTQVLRDDASHVAAYKNLGEVLFAAGRLDAWRANFLRFETHCPQSLPLAIQALEVCQHFGDFERLEFYLDGLRNERFTTATPAELVQCLEELLYLLLFFDVEPDIVHRFAQTYDATAKVVYGGPLSRTAERKPGRLRIGYMSADLRNHVMGKMMWEAVARHDRTSFELFFYSLSAVEDSWTARYRRLADHYTVLAHVPERHAARRIAEDDLDILVDLSTHTRGAKPGILAMKPARVQITHVASAGSVGLSTVDYKLTDQYADVPANQESMIERLLAMEGCVYPYRHIAPAARHGYDRARLGIPAAAFVIGAFVTPMKLSRRCLRLWTEVLQRIPHACLAISPNNPALQTAFVHLAQAAGISRERIVVVPQGRDEHENQARYVLVDAVLDPMPFGGVNGTIEALDMGVPVVTLCGGRHGERTSYSILANLGVTATVAMSGPEYVEAAVRLAQDAAFMREVREKIRRGIAHSPLTDMTRHTRHLEGAYRAALEMQPSTAGADVTA